MATEEDVTDIFNLYHEYFDNDAHDEDGPPIPDVVDDKQELNNCGGDFGMEVEATMTPASLALSLGFLTGLPPLFNTLRHRSRISPWEDSTLFVDPNTDPLPEHLSKMRLHWHQLGGVHSIVRSVFLKDADPHHSLGVLVGDEVGLGKTAQSIAFMAFLNQAIWLQQGKRKLPRILGEIVSTAVSPVPLVLIVSSRQRNDITLEQAPRYRPCHISLFAPAPSWRNG